MSPKNFKRGRSVLVFASAFAMPLVLSGSIGVGSTAKAASSAAGDEFLANIEAVPPNIIFLIDMTMNKACGEEADPPDTGTTDTGTADTSTGDTGDTSTGDTADTGACSSDADCDDGAYCNGEEVCNSGSCESGTAPSTDDGISCTTDFCNELTDSIGHFADDSACDDGDPSNGSETCDLDLGCVSGDTSTGDTADTGTGDTGTGDTADTSTGDTADTSGGTGYYYGYDSGYYYNYYGYDSGYYYNYYGYDSGYYYNYYGYDTGYYYYPVDNTDLPGAIGDGDRRERRAARNRMAVAGDDTGDTGAAGEDCIEYVKSAIEQVSKHYSWANFGVIATTTTAGNDSFTPVAPVGSTADEIKTALDALDTSAGGVRNLSEALSSLAEDYLTETNPSHPVDPWKTAPIQYNCQDTHVITITSGTPSYDENATQNGTAGMTSDVICDDDYNKVSPDEYCLYDNAAYNLYHNFDARSDLSDDQNVVVHTLGVKIEGSDLAEELYGNASDEIDGAGIYIVANSGDEILAKLLYVLNDVRAGYYSRSAPVVTAEGNYMLYSFYQIAGLTALEGEENGSSILAQGHVRAYELDDDPTSATYGQVLYNGSSQFGGAIWDAGDLLVSRPVLAAESNPMDQDGFGQRDIFTFVPEVAAAAGASHSVWAEDSSGAQTNDRMNFDLNFVDAVDNYSLLDHFMDDSNLRYDMDSDDDVDADDLQSLVDFTRGLPEATFRYLQHERGYWKLGDSPYATPAVVTARNNSYTSDATYRRFLKALDENQQSNPSLYPDLVLLPANDGMLHAFALEDYLNSPASTLGSPDDDQAGEELWAWVLGYPMYRYDDGSVDDDDGSEGWSGRLVDLMLFGRTYVFDGSPVVEDVWIDMDGDGAKSCWVSTFPSGCEWRRVVVVQQGKGGPSTLALDITVPAEPRFLWEHLNPNSYDGFAGGEVDETAVGHTVSRPSIVNLYDRETAHGAVHDRWVAIWGTGRAVPYSSSTDYYASTEPVLYFHHMSDTYSDGYLDEVNFSIKGSNGHPESGVLLGSLDTDADGRYEYGYISGAVAAIDYDSDGDVDVLYFPVTASYEPTDMGDPDGDTLTGLADMAEPGSTWMYKAVIDTEDLDDPEWCEFVDPMDYGVVDANSNAYRPEVFYAATAAWHDDGSLGIYWGSGSPYDRLSANPGYFFAFKDNAALSCPAAPEPICNTNGYTEMDAGEGLTGDPIIYSSVIYFPTYVPDLDRCENGKGRIWGLDFETCAGGLDTDGDGEADSENVETDGYPSEIVVTEQGKLLWGTSDLADQSNSIVSSLTPVVDPFNGVDTMMLREVF